MRQDGGEPECNESQEDAGLGNKKVSVNNLPKFGNEILKNQEVQIPKYNQTQSTNQEEH